MKLKNLAPLLLILLPSLVFGDPKGPTGPASSLYPKGEAEGDASQSLRSLLDTIEQHPNSPALVLSLSRLARFEPLVKGGRQEVARRLKALYQSKVLSNHWNRELLINTIIDHERAEGHLQKALAYQSGRGYVRRWLGIGPFGRSYRAGLETVTELELDLLKERFDSRKKYSSRRQQILWTDLTKDQSQWSLRASLFSISKGGGTYYTATEIDSPKKQSGWLVYTGQSAKIWVNRVLIGRVDRQWDRHPRALRFPIRLRKGLNRLMVKIPGGAMSFSMRLASETGQSLTFKERKGFHFADTALASKVQSVSPRLTATHEDFKSLASWSMDLKVCYAFYLMSVQGLTEEGVVELEAVLKQNVAKNSAWIHMLAGLAYESASHLGRSVRVPRAKSEFEQALKLNKGLCRTATRRLAQILRSQNKTVDAVTMLEDALGDEVKDIETAMALYRLFVSQNWMGEAADVLKKMIKEHGPLPSLMRLRAAEYMSLGQQRKATAINEELYKTDRRMSWMLSRRRRQATTQGRFKDALAILNQERQLQPSYKVAHRNSEIRIYRAMANVKKELQALRALVDLQPENISVLERLGQRLAEINDKACQREAVDTLKSVLARAPSRHDLRSLVHELEGKQSKFWHKWDVTSEDLLKMKVKVGTFPEASTILLFDQEITKIFEDGSLEQVITQAWRIVDDRGVEKMGARPERGQLMAIQTLLPDGTILEPIRTSGGGYQMPGLKAGAIVLHKYRVTRGAPGFQFSYGPWWFQDSDLEEPFALSRWVLISSDKAPIKILERNMPVEAQVQKKAGWTTRIWETRLLDRVEPEPNMPTREEILPHVRLYEPRSLAQILPFYKDIPLGRSHVTPSIAKKAALITKGLSTSFSKAYALFRFVKDEIKAGGGGSAAQILAARRGSFLTLYRALLKAVKIPFDDAVAALNPAVQIPTAWARPAYGQFQTSLIRMEFDQKRVIWLSSEGGRYMPFGALPERIWGAPVLLLGPNIEGLRTLPDKGSSALGNFVDLEISLGQAGGATLKRLSKALNFGSFAVKELVSNLSKAQLKNFLQRQANAQFPGAQVKSFGFPGAKIPKTPFTTSETILVNKFVHRRGDGKLIMPLGFKSLSLSRAFGGRPTRSLAIVLRSWLNFHDRVQINPGKYSVSALPSNIFIKKHYAAYSLTFRRKGEIIIIERHLTFPPGRIPAKDYGDFLRFLEAIDTAELSNLIVERSP
jgi:hypothetical protein